MRPCVQCGIEFNPDGGRRVCHNCRNSVPCPTCGGRMRKGSKGCMKCRSQGGTENGNWRDGTTRHKKGYVLQRVGNAYVMQHRFVMEQMLGRPLLVGENVHHKNGIRDDNRPENLELWVTTQPSGQRPEDLVAWAMVILARYEH